jgi:hypothetical protein
MSMDTTHLKLDGNAMGGMLEELFVGEITDARGQCAACGSVADIGAQHVYMYPLSPGAVLRCASCESVLVVVVRTPGHVRFGLRGLAWVEVAQADAAS